MRTTIGKKIQKLIIGLINLSTTFRCQETQS